MRQSRIWIAWNQVALTKWEKNKIKKGGSNSNDAAFVPPEKKFRQGYLLRFRLSLPRFLYRTTYMNFHFNFYLVALFKFLSRTYESNTIVGGSRVHWSLASVQHTKHASECLDSLSFKPTRDHRYLLSLWKRRPRLTLLTTLSGVC